MNRLRLILLLSLLVIAGRSALAFEPCRVAVLREADSGIAVEFIPLQSGAETALPEDAITVVLPFGVGQSGDLIQEARPKGRMYARCEDGKLIVRIEKSAGESRDLPPVSVKDLPRHRIRVNVIRGDGYKRAFVLRNYSSATIDSGPVIDLFQGKIPMADGDVSVTTEVSEELELARPEGFVAAFDAEGLTFAEGVNAGGKAGLFVVDIGAASTLVCRDFLPKGISISEVYGVEHSEKGERKVAGWIGGAGGAVSNFLGAAEIGDLKLGDVTFDRVSAKVVESFPKIAGKKLAGIIGLDLLSRAEAASFEYRKEEVSIELGAREKIVDSASKNSKEVGGDWIPYTMVSEHIFLEGEINGHPASVVLDSGARVSILSPDLAEKAGLKPVPGKQKELRGMDENAIMADGVQVQNLTLGGFAFENVPFYRAKIAAFAGMGITEGGVLLGNDFLVSRGALKIDFTGERILLGR